MQEAMFVTLLFVLMIHLGIVIFLSTGINRWRSAANTTLPSISVIIAARNEEQNLKALIPRLLEQGYPNFEISIGLDRCDDQSLKYLQSIDDPKLRFIDINEVVEGWNSKKYALNEAIKNSNGEWLVFTDADCIPFSEDWLISLAKQTTEQTDIVIGLSPYESEGTFLSHYIRFESFSTAFLYSAFTILRKPYMAVGRNMAVRKTLFSQNGYNSIRSIKGGDDDLFVQQNADPTNTRMVMGKASLTTTKPSRSWDEYWRQKVRHYSVSNYYKAGNQFILGFHHLAHLLFYLLLPFSFTSHYFFPIILFHLFIKLVSYRFAASKMGFGFNYILLPFVDIIYAFLTPVFGIWSKLEKDIKWKN